MEVQKGVQCTCQAKTVVGSSFTSLALLVCPSSTVHPTVNLKITNIMPVKSLLYVALLMICALILYECGFYSKQKLDFSFCTIFSCFHKPSIYVVGNVGGIKLYRIWQIGLCFAKVTLQNFTLAKNREKYCT